MSYIEMPVAEYRRRLAAQSARRPTDAGDEVALARARFPQAFAALDADASLSPGELAARERLIAAAIRIGYAPPT